MGNGAFPQSVLGILLPQRNPSRCRVSADLLSVYEREDKDGGEGRGDSNGYA